MPLNRILLDVPQAAIGRPLVFGEQNLVARGSVFLNFNYSLSDGDYRAGFFSYCTIIDMSLSLNNAQRTIAFRDANPPEFDLGGFAFSAGDRVFNRGSLTALQNRVTRQSRLFPLSRAECSRPKRSFLVDEPRLKIASSTDQLIRVTGTVSPAPTISTITGFVVGTGGGNISATSINQESLTSNGGLNMFRNSFTLESNDGILDSSTDEPPLGWQPRNNINNLGEIYEPTEFRWWLRPGISGTIRVRVIHSGELEDAFFNPNLRHIPGPFLL